MFTAERRQHIMDVLRRAGRVQVLALSVELGVSEDTIRRDLRDMATEGLLQRVHGGALPSSPATVEYSARVEQAPSAKEAIARAAAGLIRDGQVVILDGGTTNVLLAQCLPPQMTCTVITHCPPVAIALVDHPRVEVVLIGGRFYKHSMVAVGAAAVEAIEAIRADLYMLGVCSLHPEVGISNQDLEESYVKRAMIHSAAEVVALASPEKLGTAAPYIIAPLRELTHLVTDKSVPDERLQPYRDLGITVIKA
jgi:DeoR/GlpR family transcriptional regulator of sugar metabolism